MLLGWSLDGAGGSLGEGCKDGPPWKEMPGHGTRRQPAPLSRSTSGHPPGLPFFTYPSC